MVCKGVFMTNKTWFQKYLRAAACVAPRLLLILTAFLLLLLIGAVVANRTTLAGNAVGSFEIDGNLMVNHLVPPVDPIDWQSNPSRQPLPRSPMGQGQPMI